MSVNNSNTEARVQLRKQSFRQKRQQTLAGGYRAVRGMQGQVQQITMRVYTLRNAQVELDFEDPERKWKSNALLIHLQELEIALKNLSGTLFGELMVMKTETQLKKLEKKSGKLTK